MNSDNTMSRREIMRIELAQKVLEHHDLDTSILAIQQTVNPDMLTLQRLKRSKLLLKDQISRLEDQITPDIIA